MTAQRASVMSSQRAMMVLAGSLAMVLSVTPLAYAAPGEDDIARAKAEEQAAQMSVARIEVELATVAAESRAAQKNAEIAAERYNGARFALEEATKAAEDARNEAVHAKEEYERGRHNIASVVQTAYRSGGTSLDALAPYLESDGLRQVESRQNSLAAIGDAASTKMQEVAALEQVATVMENVAEKAQELQEQKTAEVEKESQAAQEAVNAAAAVEAEVAMRRDVLYAELARKQNTTVELIKAKEQAEAEARAKAEAEAARRAAEEAARRAEEERREAARRAEQEAARQAEEESVYYDEPPRSYTPAPAPAPAPNVNKAQGAINAAMQMLGARYVWGGEGPQDGGYDCSGLVKMAWQTQGVYLEHWSVAQYRYGGTGGSYVPLAEMQPGDLVFWSHDGSVNGVYHVAMYIGGGQIVEAATFGIPARVTGLYDRWEMMPYAVRVA